MALTNEEKQELLNAMKAESQGVDELEQVDTLDGIMSLPALRGEEVVSAPIKLLTKPAEDAVANAVSAANRATEAAQTVYSITQVANSAASAANAAASAASDAAEEANSAVAAASEVVAKYENVAKAAFNGATARFFLYGGICHNTTSIIHCQGRCNRLCAEPKAICLLCGWQVLRQLGC